MFIISWCDAVLSVKSHTPFRDFLGLAWKRFLFSGFLVGKGAPAVWKWTFCHVPSTLLGHRPKSFKIWFSRTKFLGGLWRSNCRQFRGSVHELWVLEVLTEVLYSLRVWVWRIWHVGECLLHLVHRAIGDSLILELCVMCSGCMWIRELVQPGVWHRHSCPQSNSLQRWSDLRSVLWDQVWQCNRAPVV